MTTVRIDNGKSPSELYNASLGFWLPPDSPYGNLTLKLMKLCERIDEANLRLTESCAFWEQARADGTPPNNASQRHTYANEQAIYLLRRSADEMIALICCLYKWEANHIYPRRIKIDSIGTLLLRLEQFPDQHLKPCSQHVPLLTVLNEISNAFKHSFVNSDISIIGRDEPLIFALSLDDNRLVSGTKFHSVSLLWLAKAFTDFYKDCMDWLRAFSQRNLSPPVKEHANDAKQ